LLGQRDVRLADVVREAGDSEEEGDEDFNDGRVRGRGRGRKGREGRRAR
jgi:hypothetical protein